MSQCTTKHCFDDENDFTALTEMVYRLQNTVERQQQNYQEQQKQLAKLKEILKRRLPARDCYDLLQVGYNVSGVYEIYLDQARKYIQVYCDMETDGGGWLVFQRRQDGSVDFWRDWSSYKKGFGDLSGEFWLGNEYLHDLTSQANYTLRFDLEDFEDATRYAVYTHFVVASEGNKYRLSVGGYYGTAGDQFQHHDGMSFSTKDRDHDTYPGMHCAQAVRGAWWYSRCYRVCLNGQYLHGRYTSFHNGVTWASAWHGEKYSLKKADMKLRPQQS
ncbi:Ryncolin-1 [Lamellibrachia satsuma]|nr:Ryncolin-1 [Lamellibrachia satsuma]